MCYPHATNKQQVAKSLKKITINEFTVSGIAFVFGIWNKALNESVINTIFSNFVRCIRLGYKYAVWIPLVSWFYFFVCLQRINQWNRGCNQDTTLLIGSADCHTVQSLLHLSWSNFDKTDWESFSSVNCSQGVRAFVWEAEDQCLNPCSTAFEPGVCS